MLLLCEELLILIKILEIHHFRTTSRSSKVAPRWRPKSFQGLNMTNSLIRLAWTPVTIAMMVIGFMIAWPLGLAMLTYIIWGDRLEAFKKDVNCATDKVADTIKKSYPPF